MTDTTPATSPPSLFFEGSIESAINSSLTRSLPLACFIADDGSESSTWQHEYMEDEEVLPLLKSRCVLLRLQAGSVEAGFLQAFCPIQTVPYLVVIRNGTMVANIKAGAVKDDFTVGVKAALSENETVAAPVSLPQPADVASPPPQPQPSSSTTPSQPSQPQSQPSQPQSQPSQSQPQPSQSQPQPQPSARRDSTTPVPSSSRRESSAGHLAYLEQQRKRQLAAAEDRKRVLQLVENDKIERRQRASTTSTSAAPVQSTRHSTPPPPRATPEETALSFRLLDGTSLKSRFASTATLATEVRRWLDEHRTDNSDHPYSFLQIMAPLPNKQLSLSDEGSTLVELGLAPTATLVLVPAQSYVSAYNGGGTSNEVGFLSRAYSLIYGAVTTVLGVGYPATPAPAAAAAPTTPTTPAAAAPAPAEAPPSLGATLGRAGRSEARETQSVSRASSANGRIRTLYNAAEEAGGKEDTGRKYYNGNQLDFEPKRDEKGKERKE